MNGLDYARLEQITKVEKPYRGTTNRFPVGSKEIAQELREQMGDNAYLFCVEKLSNGTEQPRLWRDVLDWLDEIKEPASAGSLTKGETE